jgi:Ca-activated chloride channel family protein
MEQHETALLTGNALSNKVEQSENINISVNLNTGTALQNIQSEHHTIHVDTSNSNTYHVSLNQEPVKLHDFVLNWQPELGSTPSSAHFTQFVNGDEYGLIVLYPPLPEEQPLLDREVIFVLDTSGSMAGEALVQAKQALAYAIDDLSTRDKFNIIEFNSHAEILWRKSTFADAQSKMEAFNFISGLTANGGTEMHQALSMALLSEADPELFKQILFITDGSVSNESSLMTLIKNNLHESRLFTIGIGAAPNSYFMTEAAKSGKGSFTFIGDTAQVKQKMSDLLAKITSPALTDIQLNLKGIKQYQDFEMYPKVIGDLYSSEPLVLTYKQAMNDTHLKALSDESKQVNGVTEEHILVGTYNNSPWLFNSPKVLTNDVDQFAAKQKAKGINVLWAREKIAQLTRDKRDLASSGSNAYTHFQSPSKERQAQIELAEQEIIQEMTATALEHHIVSEYTSLVAVDIVATKPTSLKQAITLPQTATSAQLNILIGSILLFLSLLLYKFPIRNMKQK